MTQPSRPAPALAQGSCNRRCAGREPPGRRCICNGGIRHVYHICKEPRCVCHDLREVRKRTRR
jgi:hypothetical protein